MPLKPHLKFSPQEARLFELLIQDLRMKEIASRMGLEKQTIDTYAKNLYKKCGVESRIGLILWTLAAAERVD